MSTLALAVDTTNLRRLQVEAEKAGATDSAGRFSQSFIKALAEYQAMPKCSNPDCVGGDLKHSGFCGECEAGKRKARQHEASLATHEEAVKEAARRRTEKAWGPLEIPPEFSNLPAIYKAFGRDIAEEKRAAIKAAQDVAEGVAKNPLKVFYGSVGTGKSALVARVAEAIGHGVFITMKGFLDEITGAEWEEKLVKMRAAQTCPLLILDDLCNPEPDVSKNGKGWNVKRLTQWQRETLLDLLDHRIKWHLPTLITTNLTGTLNAIELQLRQQLDERLTDRLITMFHWVEMGGANLRRIPKKGAR